jgi:hypothetical protein
MRTYTSIKKYLADLEGRLEGADPAIVVDALDDAEEHLEEMVQDLIESKEQTNTKDAVSAACESYGAPGIVAKGYLKQDKSWQKKKKKAKHEEGSLLKRTFGVYVQGRTYLSMLYLFLMFPLGIFYFTYIVTGFSLCAGLIVTIIGIPLGILFLLSFLGLGWFHGRLTEALLGIRMPRKRRRSYATGTTWQKFKTTMKEPRLYSTILYMFLMFPLGILYFVVLLTFLSVSLALICAPILYLVATTFNVPVGIPAPLWFQCLVTLLGVIMMTWTLHLNNILAMLQGKLTTALLLKK